MANLARSREHIDFVDGNEFYKLPDGRSFRPELGTPLDAGGCRARRFVTVGKRG